MMFAFAAVVVIVALILGRVRRAHRRADASDGLLEALGQSRYKGPRWKVGDRWL